MSDLQKLSHVEERAEIHRQYFYKLCHIKARVDRLHWPTLNDEQLQSMSVRIIDDLDVDEASPCDFGPRYFAPLPRSRLPDLIEQGEANLRDWYPKCAGNIDNIDEPPCLRFHEAMHRITWFNRSYGSACYGPFYDESDWELQDMDEGKDKLPFYQGYEHYMNPRYPKHLDLMFKAETAYAIKDGSSPHMISEVGDNDVAGSEILRSDIVTAIVLMKRQLRSMRFIDHHTIPVMIISIQHDSAARITQAHFDGEHIHLRRSRQLDLAADKPTDDAYLILRWVSCRPVGDTLYGDIPCPDDADEGPVAWREPPSNAVAVKA